MDLDGYHRGIELFNQGEFFDAHEVLEDVWRAAPSEEKKFLQGLIQIAVGLHHHSTGNKVGARSLLARADKNLSAYSEGLAGLQLTPLRIRLASWIKALDNGHAIPPLPRIEVVPTRPKPEV
jgi:predicted metal-dependent hydrolase